MLEPGFRLTTAELASLHNDHLSIPVPDALFRVEGPGTFSCLQGLLTNDVSKLESGQAAWGAFLTPKGMIVSDAWVIRDGDAAWVAVPDAGHDAMKLLFGRTMPPRLAKVADQGAALRLRWLIGGAPASVDGAVIALPVARAPFAALAIAPESRSPAPALHALGWREAPATFAEAVKLLMGWPTLGREIDERTLPQEVRFDELGGVKYDKGCYTGQETVARLHFRGHANRSLRGLVWSGGDGPTSAEITHGDKVVGTVRTLAQLGERTLALAVMRREVATGESVLTGETGAEVVELPFDTPPVAVA
jgi:tRNA-modifying protein YgfZ